MHGIRRGYKIEVKPDGNKLYSVTEQGSRAAGKEKRKGKKQDEMHKKEIIPEADNRIRRE